MTCRALTIVDASNALPNNAFQAVGASVRATITKATATATLTGVVAATGGGFHTHARRQAGSWVLRVASLVAGVAVALAGAVHAGGTSGAHGRIDVAAGGIAATVAAEADLWADTLGVGCTLGAAAIEAEGGIVSADA